MLYFTKVAEKNEKPPQDGNKNTFITNINTAYAPPGKQSKW